MTEYKPLSSRLESLDVLRGADMFFLLLLGPVLLSICKLWPEGTEWLSRQLQHTKWDGFVAWDIIMPLFLFMSGITIPFSMARYRNGEKPGRKFWLKLLKRFILLFFLGWVVQGNLLLWDWKMFHPFANTLQAIAVGYVVAAILFVYLKPKWQLVAVVLLFAAYWIAFACTGMNVDPRENVAMVVDKAVLGCHRDGVEWAADGTWRFMKRYQYTWVLSSLNFAVTVLLGCFAGQMLRSDKHSPAKRALLLAVGGAGLVAAGCVLSPLFPIIKKIWSSTMTLFSGGICFMLIALFYYIIDVRGWRKGFAWLKPYGMNAITAYCVGELIKFDSVSASLLPGFADCTIYPVLIALFNGLILYFLLLAMYKFKVFLKV